MSRFADAVQMLLLGPSQSQLFLNNLWARMRDNLAQGDPNRFSRFGQQMVGVMEILFAMFDCACLEAFGQLMCTGCGSSCLSHSGRLGHDAVRSSMQFAFDLQQEPELRARWLWHINPPSLLMARRFLGQLFPSTCTCAFPALVSLYIKAELMMDVGACLSGLIISAVMTSSSSTSTAVSNASTAVSNVATPFASCPKQDDEELWNACWTVCNVVKFPEMYLIPKLSRMTRHFGTCGHPPCCTRLTRLKR